MTRKTSFARLAFGAALFAAVGAVSAQTPAATVTDAWVRGTVPQQKASGLFAKVTAPQGGRLVGASSPVAGVVEIHEMSMDGSTMRMRAITSLELPAGTTVELRPGGHHVMLLELKQQLKDGDVVPVTLVVDGADGKRQLVEVQAPVRPLGATTGGGHGGHKH